MGGKKKIGLIGGGQIGGNLALLSVQKQLGDVVLYDIPAAEGLVKGKALDINQLAAVDGYDCRVTGTTDWKDVAGSDVVHHHRRHAAQAGHDAARTCSRSTSRS